MSIGFIRSGQRVLVGHEPVIGFGDDAFCVRVVQREVATKIIIANHYSHKVFNGSTEHHGVFIDGALVGVLQWGSGLNPSSGRGVVTGTKNGDWRELNRMWLDDSAPRNSESRAIAYSLRLLTQNAQNVGWVQSFADERCGGLGVVYQACSFLYLGEHTSEFYELDGEFFHKIAATCTASLKNRAKARDVLMPRIHEATVHRLRQFRYFKALKKWAARGLVMAPQPYPKRPAEEGTL